MINIPSTIQTSNTEGIKKIATGERVSRIEKTQNVMDKPSSRKNSRQLLKQYSESDQDKQDRRNRVDRRKNNSTKFLFDSRSSQGRRSREEGYPSIDIEV